MELLFSQWTSEHTVHNAHEKQQEFDAILEKRDTCDCHDHKYHKGGK